VLGRHDVKADNGVAERKLIVRFHATDALAVAAALEAAGFPVIESVNAQHAALAA
jgi:hypothetical protein